MKRDVDGAHPMNDEPGEIASRRPLSPEARRALAEAEQRKAKAIDDAAKAKEYNGRGGLEPVRFGDWEVKGIATDF